MLCPRSGVVPDTRHGRATPSRCTPPPVSRRSCALIVTMHRLAGSIAIDDLLAAMKSTRVVFHSEADFQHHLAWQAHLLDPQLQVRLEFRPDAGIRESVDVMLVRPDLGMATFIELKYLKAAWSGQVSSEQFDLPNTGAHDIVRYDVIKDIERLERFVDGRPSSNGLMLCLTNDSLHWREPIGMRATIAEAFASMREMRSRSSPMGSEGRCWHHPRPHVPSEPSRAIRPSLAALLENRQWTHRGVPHPGRGRRGWQPLTVANQSPIRSTLNAKSCRGSLHLSFRWALASHRRVTAPRSGPRLVSSRRRQISQSQPWRPASPERSGRRGLRVQYKRALIFSG